MEEYRAILDRILARFRSLSRDIAANLSDDVPEQANFKLAFKDYFDAFGRFYNSTYNDLLAFRSSEEEAQNFDVGLDDWRARYATISGLEPSNPNASESDTWRALRVLGWGALGVGALFGVGWLVASAVKGASAFKPSLTIGENRASIRRRKRR